MKKFKLKIPSDIGDVMTREELKNVFGGSGHSPSIGKGACGGIDANVESACVDKPVGSTCSYCLMKGTEFEQPKSGICWSSSSSSIIVNHKKYCKS